MRRVIDQMHINELTIVYGLTETSPGLTQTPRDADLVERTQTVGRVMPETDVRIVNPQTGEDVGPGVDGVEHLARGIIMYESCARKKPSCRSFRERSGRPEYGDVLIVIFFLHLCSNR